MDRWQPTQDELLDAMAAAAGRVGRRDADLAMVELIRTAVAAGGAS